LPKPLKTYAALMFLSALTTPSELFLIMKMRDMGLPQYQMPLAWFVMTFFTLIATYGADGCRTRGAGGGRSP
jgi:hypothetical protein